MKSIRIVLSSIKKADDNYKLINTGDRIVIGISGGKDSLALLYALHYYKLYSKKDYTLIPIMIDLGFPNFKPNRIIKFCKSLGYDLQIKDSKEVFDILLKNKVDGKHIPCSICSRMKKAIINKTAHENNSSKVAFAHHYDDALETLFMNIFYAGKIATFEPKMFLSNEKITFIRPLIMTLEKDIINLSKELKLPVMKSSCPADKKTTRETTKQFIKKLIKSNKYISKNLYTALDNEEQIKLWHKE